MASEELLFANDARGAVERASRTRGWFLLVLVIALLALLAAWANWAKVPKVTSGIGRVVPSQQTQIVESLEPGIVAEILVREGDIVEAGQGLIRIDDTGASSKQGELRRRQASLTAELDRLRAHAGGAETFEIPGDVDASTKAFYADQRASFVAKKNQLAELAGIREQKLAQKINSLAEVRANIVRNEELLGLANEELKLVKRLYSRKAVTQLEFIQAQRESTRLKGEIAVGQASLKRLQSEVEEAKASLKTDETEYLTEIGSRISKINADLAVIQQTLRAANDTVRRTMLRAPVAGTVNKLSVAAVNEVVNAGTSVVEIIPKDDRLLIEARVRPEDIGFIHPDLSATIRITAYDYTKFGTLSGRVERIGADSVTDDQGNTFYRVIVQTDLNDGEYAKSSLQVIPGMIATVDIETGSRTILEYLLKPVLVMKDRALRDPR